MAKEGRKAGIKTPSQELRETFFKLYEKDSERFETFEEYYNSKMNKLINHYKRLI